MPSISPADRTWWTYQAPALQRWAALVWRQHPSIGDAYVLAVSRGEAPDPRLARAMRAARAWRIVHGSR